VYCDQLIKFADTGLGVTAFASSIGTARSTIHLWATRHKEFREAMEIAAAKRQYRLERDMLELDEAISLSKCVGDYACAARTTVDLTQPVSL